MVFVHARNETVRTAMVLRETAKNKDHIHSFAPQGKNLGLAQKSVSYVFFFFFILHLPPPWSLSCTPCNVQVLVFILQTFSLFPYAYTL